MHLCVLGVLMAKKYCEKCHLPVEMLELECPSCSNSTFLHSLPNLDFCDCGVPLINGDSCDSCSKKISPSRLQILNTKPTELTLSPRILKAASNNPESLSGTLNSSDSNNIGDLIRAQNRTTHAVRAFVRFLFIQLSGITFAVFSWNLSTASIDQQKCIQFGTNCTGDTLFQFIAVAVWIVSVIWSSRAGWEELEKSNID